MNAFVLARRALTKDRSFSLLAVAVLSLGIGGVATQFSVINGLVLRPAAFAAPERLVAASALDVSRNVSTGGAGSADYLDWRAGQQSFEELAMYGARLSINLTIQNVPRRYGGVYVTHTFFRTIGVAPMLGRDFTANDDRAGAERTVIISHDIWQNDFSGVSTIIGLPVTINGRVGTVIGVMPPGFRFPFNEQVWSPMFAEFIPRPRGDPQSFGGAVVGRLKPGVSREQAQTELSALAQRIAAEFPATNRNLSAVELRPFTQAFIAPQLRQIMYVMLGAVAFVLLIACVNVMNMQFARAARRTRDLAICSALGASRGRLLRQMLVESLLLAAAGAVGGTLFAIWATGALLDASRSLPTPPPSWVTFDVDWRVLAATIAITGFAGILSGLAPAWVASGGSPIELMRDGGRTGPSRRVNAVIRGLVILQIALTAALLVASTFMVRSIVNQQRIDWGYDTRAVLAARMTLFQADHPTPAALGRFFDTVLRQLRADPNFAAVALSTRFRLAISQFSPLEVDGEKYTDAVSRPTAAVEPVSDGYFDALGLRLVAGRDFTAADTLDRPPVAIVNTAFAQRHFGNANPIGRRLRLANGSGYGPWLTIVGVAPDTHMAGPFNPRLDGAGLFQPIAQAPQRWVTLVVRGRGGAPDSWAEPLRRAFARIDPNQPIYMVNTVDQLIYTALGQSRLLASMFTIFGAVAMLLAAIGLYGVMSFAVSQRTCEYGIRMALGADTRQIVWLILRQGAIQLGVGLAAGLALALTLVTVGSALVENLLYKVGRADPVIWGSTVALLTLVTLIACLAPARRATRVNPVDALRAE